MKTLLGHVRSVINARHREWLEKTANKQSRQLNPPLAVESVTKEVRARLSKLLFGPAGETNASPAMKRLLTSWAEVGYPNEGDLDLRVCFSLQNADYSFQTVIQQVMNKTEPVDIEISKENLGLPLTSEGEQRLQYHNLADRTKLAPAIVHSNNEAPTPMPFTVPSQPMPIKHLASAKSIELKQKTFDSESPLNARILRWNFRRTR